jgi:hypothetical protein
MSFSDHDDVLTLVAFEGEWSEYVHEVCDRWDAVKDDELRAGWGDDSWLDRRLALQAVTAFPPAAWWKG